MRTKTGIVTSAKMKDTIVVTVTLYKKHPKYHKRYKISKKFYAHNPDNKHKEGEKVSIYECRPLSKLKRWTVVKPEKEANEKHKTPIGKLETV